MHRSVPWLLTLLLLMAGCAAKLPQPAPPAAEPKANSTPPAPPPAPPVQLPKTPPQVTLEPAQVRQGDMALLRLDQPVKGELTITVEGLSEQPKPFSYSGRPVAFVGVPAAAKVGSYPVKVTWPDGSWEGALEVVAKSFTEDRLVVTEEQQELYFDPRQQAEWAKVFRLRSQSEERPLWRAPFLVPLAGEAPITTYFGEIRFVNGVETGRHSGMDFGVPTGTPILAPAPGKVLLAESLIVTGHTVIIDHGMNLFTTYYHMDRTDVVPDQWVTQGEVIGTVGNTGFSTGPHLHWTATIGNTPVDPWPLTQRSPLSIEPIRDRTPPEE